MPIVSTKRVKQVDDFPVDHLSASSLVKFGSNPVMFKINEIQGEYIECLSSAKSVLGKGFHKAMEAYYFGTENHPVTTEDEALELGLNVGMDFLKMYNDGFIDYNKQIPNKQKLFDKFTFLYSHYVKEKGWDCGEEALYAEHLMKYTVALKWRGEDLLLPVPLKGYTDKIFRKDGLLKIKDYKTVAAFTDLEKIDGSKMLAAVTYYLLVYAETGEEPYSIVYEEVKHTLNRDGGSQIQTYEIVFADHDLYFDFFFRYYGDVVRGLNGEMVYVPNVYTLFDNEVSLVAYINKLDVDEEAAKLMKKHRVSNITDVLRKRTQKTKNVHKFMETAAKQFTSAQAINYEDMKDHDKIKTKMMEHGMMLDFDSKQDGYSVDLYRFTPSIGLAMKKIQNYVPDVEQVLGATNVRILAPIPGTTLVGFEVPRKDRQYPGAATKAQNLVLPIGVDITGNKNYIDIRTAPHVLVAGTTGSGKSETLRSMLFSIGGTAEIWIADPKGVEFNDIKCQRYAEESADIRNMLEDAVMEMDARFTDMKQRKLRDWDGKPLIVMVDEFGDFILENPQGITRYNYNNWTKGRLQKEFLKRWAKENPDKPMYDCSNFKKDTFVNVLEDMDEKMLGKYSEMSAEDLVVKLAQKARAAGIHLIIATQSPRATIITGRIKANIPTRIALRTSSEVESRIIVDTPGAEKLLGKGDMLLMRSDSNELTRLQGYKN